MSKARLQRETGKNLTYFVVQTFSAVKGSNDRDRRELDQR